MYSYSHNKRVTHSSIYFVASSYIDFITDTIPSSTPNFRKAHHTTSLETLSKAFSKSTKAIHRSFFLAKYFSCSCLTTNMASVVPLPAINPNCMSSTFTIRLTLPSITLSRIFITCSSNFIPLVYTNHTQGHPPFPYKHSSSNFYSSHLLFYLPSPLHCIHLSPTPCLILPLPLSYDPLPLLWDQMLYYFSFSILLYLLLHKLTFHMAHSQPHTPSIE